VGDALPGLISNFQFFLKIQDRNSPEADTLGLEVHPMPETHVVTGAFGFTGRHVAAALLAAGHRVRTLTCSAPAGPPDFDAGRVEVHPLDFTDPAGLVRALELADTLVNTYWVRFQAAGFDQDRAVANSFALFHAARAAGVKRIVHVSVANPSLQSPYRYFRGKAAVEEALQDSGVPHSILRPALVFGPGDVLINNIAWFLRRFPVFGVFGDGAYGVEPIHVDDLAALAVAEGARGAGPSRTVDAVGPDRFTYRDLVRTLAAAIDRPRPIVRIPRRAGLAMSRLVGRAVGDVVLTGEEIGALMDGLLATGSAPTGSIRLAEWARANAATLGRTYANEVARRRPPSEPSVPPSPADTPARATSPRPRSCC
jgi:NADH dehydrogenase